jgi:hypothetical protein
MASKLFNLQLLSLLLLILPSNATAQYLEAPTKEERANLNLNTDYSNVPHQNAKNNAKDLIDKKMLIKESHKPSMPPEDNSSIYVIIDDKKSINTNNRAMIDEYEKVQSFKKNLADTANQESDRDFKFPFPKLGFKIDLGTENKPNGKPVNK